MTFRSGITHKLAMAGVVPALALVATVTPATAVAAPTAAGAPAAVSGWPDNCYYKRNNATQARARCLAGGGFYRVVLICRSIGKSPRWAYGPWRIPGLSQPESVGTCPDDFTVSADDVGMDSKSD